MRLLRARANPATSTICGFTSRDMTQLQHLAERVERLLLRHEELQRTNALLTQQVQGLVAERDSLKSRLQAARARIDHLIDKLPHAPGLQTSSVQAPGAAEDAPLEADR